VYIEDVIVVSPRSVTYKYSNESLYELPVDAANRDENRQCVPLSMQRTSHKCMLYSSYSSRLHYVYVCLYCIVHKKEIYVIHNDCQ